MNFLPEVIRAKYDNAYVIVLSFNDGTEKCVDFSIWLNGPIFEPLKDTAYFKKFHLDGGTVCWPNGADIAPEALYAATPIPRKFKRRAGSAKGLIEIPDDFKTASLEKFEAALSLVPDVKPPYPDTPFRRKKVK